MPDRLKSNSESPKNESLGRSTKHSFLASFFPEDLKVSNTVIFHPQDKCLLAWNKLFVISCMFGIYVDPLVFFSPYIFINCIDLQRNVAEPIILLRTTIDVFYLIHIFFEFHTAYTRRFIGSSKLVTDASQIAARYKRGHFVVDVLSVLPFPQVTVMVCAYNNIVLPSATMALIPIVFLQYIPRFLRVYPLTTKLQKTAAAFPNSSIAGAVYYLLWYILVSHILGACWYLLAVQRKFDCWKKACAGNVVCDATFLYCQYQQHFEASDSSLMNIEVVTNSCSSSAENPPVTFGIYREAFTYGLCTTKNFVSIYLYCLWWGLKQLSTLAQGLQTDIYTSEMIFCLSITLSGVVHCAYLIGNMQSYLKSFTTKLEELRVQKREMEQWMHRRLLPQDLRHRVGRYNQYRWWETGGMDEETFLQSVPKDIRRDVKRHLCMDMIRKVPIFGQMDDQFLDAFCERLKSSLYTNGAYIVQEGDPVNEMVFITHGLLESVTTNAGRSESINQCILKEGDFCGEELLPWALDPQTGSTLPTSTRMVQALTEVEAFTTTPEDLKFLARQFKCLHTQQAKHLFRFYSQHWRTWAACCIQRAWRRYSERKRVLNRHRESCSPSLTSTLYAFRFIHALRGGRLEKPPEPNFTSETD